MITAPPSNPQIAVAIDIEDSCNCCCCFPKRRKEILRKVEREDVTKSPILEKVDVMGYTVLLKPDALPSK